MIVGAAVSASSYKAYNLYLYSVRSDALLRRGDRYVSDSRLKRFLRCPNNLSKIGFSVGTS